MGEDAYLDVLYEDRYDDPWWADYETGDYDLEDDEEDEPEDDNDFPEYLEYPQDYLEDIEPPF